MKMATRNLLFLFLFVFAASISWAQSASFSADVTSGCSPLVVHFTNTSTGATSYHWDLGNGTTSTLTNVSGSYITAGTYTVTLIAYNGSSSSTRTMTITVFPSPTVSFYASDTAICPYGSTTFTSTSTAGTSGGMTYLWNFGDGSSSTSANPTHVYSTPGRYTVTLVVTNSMGCSSSLTRSTYIEVYNHIGISFTVPGYACHVPAVVTFNNTTTGTSPFTYSWSFGDGNTSTATSPTNTYTATGTYNVRLIVTDGNGCTDTLYRTAAVRVGTITAAFTAVSGICVNSTAIFYNTSSTHSSSAWNYGDGGSSTRDTGSHTYRTPGTYNVRLIIFNGICYDTVIHPIVVYPPPTGSFTWSPTISCPPPTAVNFTGSVPAGSTVRWLYGDGGTGTGSSSSHTYSSSGCDTVSMIITDVNGCKDTVTQVLSLYDMIFNVSAVPSRGCSPLTVNYSYSLTGGACASSGAYPASITSFVWTFGDGSASSSAGTPTHVFTAPGVYHTVCSITTSNGCTATDTIAIYVGIPPTVTFTATPTHMCYKTIVYFTAHADSANEYRWDFGDGSTSSDSLGYTSHVFTRPGTFHVTVVALLNGCPSAPYTWTDSFIVDSPMAAGVLQYRCTPYTAVFFDDSSIGATYHIWLFGDGYTSTADTITHIYPARAIYTATLATYNSRSGCRDTAYFGINLIPPVITVTASDTAVCRDDTIRFTARITGTTPIAYGWILRDSLGTIVYSSGDSMYTWTDTMNRAGRFTMIYQIVDPHGCRDSLVKPNWIIVGKPVDTFGASVTQGCWPLTVLFRDSTRDTRGTWLTSYAWDFGDGATSTVSSSPATHVYTAAGTYSVTSVVTDNIGCMDTSTRLSYITVWRPHAAFTTSTVFPCIGAPVTFVNTSTAIVGSYWFFGDGDTSTATNPTHAYRAVGTYTVRLIVTDVHGCVDTATFVNMMTVTKPTASFTESDSFSICPPLTVRFTNTSSGATGYLWDFGDGGTSVLMSPSDLYITPAYYNTRLIAINAYGCRDTARDHVQIYGYAGAFSYTPDTGCAPLLVHFSASTRNVPHIIWDYADGITSSLSYTDTSSHWYMNPGKYLPKLILSDNTGCQNSSIAVDTIKVNAVYPGFTTNPHPVCVNTTMAYVDTSHSLFSTVTFWHWQFTAGDTSNLPSPSYFYSVVGTYPVTLTVMDGWGCTGTITQNVIVNPPPVIFAGPDTVICVGDTGTLTGSGGVSYIWTPATVLSCPTCQTTKAYPSVPTSFTVTGTDANGCTSTDSVNIFLRTKTFSRAWPDTEVCRYVKVQLFDTGANKFQWSPSDGLTDPTIFNPVATPSATTTYTVIARLGSCIPDTNYVRMIVHQLPTVVAVSEHARVLAGQAVQLNATGTDIVSYLWTPVTTLTSTLSCEDCADPVAKMKITTTFTVTVTSDFGCQAKDTVIVNMYCDESQIFIPNTFTPNGDGENDVFYPRGAGVTNIKAFRVYNRWGELLFERTNLKLNDKTNAWDGTFQGGTPRPDVYVYLIDAICDTGQPLFLKGDVTIVK